MKYYAEQRTDYWVVTCNSPLKDGGKMVIATIPSYWRNAKSIAMYLADSANRNKRLVLTPEI